MDLSLFSIIAGIVLFICMADIVYDIIKRRKPKDDGCCSETGIEAEMAETEKEQNDK